MYSLMSYSNIAFYYLCYFLQTGNICFLPQSSKTQRTVFQGLQGRATQGIFYFWPGKGTAFPQKPRPVDSGLPDAMRLQISSLACRCHLLIPWPSLTCSQCPVVGSYPIPGLQTHSASHKGTSHCVAWSKTSPACRCSRGFIEPVTSKTWKGHQQIIYLCSREWNERSMATQIVHLWTRSVIAARGRDLELGRQSQLRDLLVSHLKLHTDSFPCAFFLNSERLHSESDGERSK